MIGGWPRRAVLLGVVLALTAGAAPAAAADVLGDVDVFAGTAQGTPDFGTGGGAGNTFPGADRPFGAVQWSPDTVPSTGNVGGAYTYGDTRLRGFSLDHLSGPGCAVFGDVPFLPLTSIPKAGPSGATAAFRHADEHATPGTYSLRLSSGVQVDLAAAVHGGVGRFTFPSTRAAGLLVDVGGGVTPPITSSVRIDPGRHEVTGAVRNGRFCYHRNRYHLYFVARFSRRFARYATWRGRTLTEGGRTASATGPDGLPPHRAESGAYVGWDARGTRAVEVRVGVSFTSLGAARRNLAADVGWRSYAALAGQAHRAWRSALGRIGVSGGARGPRRAFYTALYHALLFPSTFSDAGGTYRGMDDRVHRVARGHVRYANFSGWDVYRTQTPLLSALFPGRAADMARSLVADARENGGWLPKWSVANGQTDEMVGDPADPILASTWAFGARGFGVRDALRAAVHGATRVARGPNGDYVERQGLVDYLRRGYVPVELDTPYAAAGTVVDTSLVWGSAATTLEYATADFAVARLAAAVGDRATYRRFMRRSANWRTLLRAGWLRPRRRDGTFPAFSPTDGTGWVEGDAAQYRWAVPQDVGGLLGALGGRGAARSRLDAFFTELSAGPRSSHAYLGNEPTMGTPWLYDWAGAPWRAQDVARRAAGLMRATPGGFPGNDDLGTMSAWLVWNDLGLYPSVPGTDVLAVSTPRFPRITVRLPHGTVRINAPGAAGRRYIHRYAVGRKATGKPWVRFGRLARGARIDVRVGARPDRGWGTGRGDAPPSFGPRAPMPAKCSKTCP